MLSELKKYFTTNVFLISIFVFMVFSIFPGFVEAAGDPFAIIEKNLKSGVNDLIKILQIFGVLGLVGYGVISVLNGSFDKARLGVIVAGIAIISLAQQFVEMIQNWS